jgi:hypothetical protein
MPTERPPTLPMFDDGLPPTRRHKRVRQTAREVYRVRRAQDIADAEHGRETRQGAVLRILARHWNTFQFSPTAYELLTFALEVGERRWRDIASFRPRLTELTALGIIEPTEPRRCRVTGVEARCWRVREIGSAEAR